ncbi:MAG: glycosyltransferase family 2 protein [Bacteroidota bacterium]
MEILFWLFLAIVIYTYLGYGILLTLLVKIKQRISKPFIPRSYIPEHALPSVTHLVAAYNEEEFIEYKINNSLKLDYPKEKMNLIIVSDGSSDKTPELAGQYTEVTHMFEPERKGKIAAVKRAMKEVETSIVIFSDANTYLNKDAIKKIVAHFEDVRVGAVAGEKRIYKPEETSASVAGEGLYWKYESYLKRMDSEFYSVVGAAGELFAIRKELMPVVPTDTIIEDLYLTMSIAMKGRRVAYESEAYAMETGSSSIEEEMKRKVRICAGGFQAIQRLKEVFNPFTYKWLTFQFISHRALRWTLAPLALPIVFLSNFFLCFSQNPLYLSLFAGQVLFYLLAGFGYLKRNEKRQNPIFFVPFYFSMMHFSAFKGFARFLKKNQTVVWERAERKTGQELVGSNSSH